MSAIGPGGSQDSACRGAVQTRFLSLFGILSNPRLGGVYQTQANTGLIPAFEDTAFLRS